MKLNQVLSQHEQVLSLRARRTELLANNLANQETPNYLARDFDINAAIKNNNLSALSLAKTNGQHLAASGNLGGQALQYRLPSQPSLDGNSVDPQIEKAEFASNSMQYLATVNFLKHHIRTMQMAIKGE